MKVCSFSHSCLCCSSTGLDQRGKISPSARLRHFLTHFWQINYNNEKFPCVELAVDVVEGTWGLDLYFFDKNGEAVGGRGFVNEDNEALFQYYVEETGELFEDGGAIALFIRDGSQFFDAVGYGLDVSTLMLDRGCTGDSCLVPEFPAGVNPVPVIPVKVTPNSGKTLSRYGCGFAPEDFLFRVDDDTKGIVNNDQMVMKDGCPTPGPSVMPSFEPSAPPSQVPSTPLPSSLPSVVPSTTSPTSLPSTLPSTLPTDTPTTATPTTAMPSTMAPTTNAQACTTPCKTKVWHKDGMVMSKPNLFGNCKSECVVTRNVNAKYQRGWACGDDCNCVQPCIPKSK